jgi:hypothetical protein
MGRFFLRQKQSQQRVQLGLVLANVCLLIGLLAPPSATARVLENPSAQSTVSGIDTIFGWVHGVMHRAPIVLHWGFLPKAPNRSIPLRSQEKSKEESAASRFLTI